METLQNEDLFPRIPEELKELDQWVVWQYENDTKVPKNPSTIRNAGVNWSNTWSSYDHAVEVGQKHNLGIGFVLTPDDPYTCIDLDHCWKKGEPLDDQTRYILDLLQGYTEASPSLTGLHVWIKSEEAVNRRTSGIEIYSYGRWLTMTGRANPQTPQIIPDRTQELQELIARFFTQTPLKPNPRASNEVLDDDREIWNRLFNSRNGHIFSALFNGDLSVTRNDHSRGVIFLANMFAMMTNGDRARMERLLRQTALQNEKWDSKRGDKRWIDLEIESALKWYYKNK